MVCQISKIIKRLTIYNKTIISLCGENFCYKTSYENGEDILNFFIKMCNNLKVIFDKNLVSRILLEYTRNSKYYMINKVDSIILNVMDNPFLIFKNKNIEHTNKGRSLTIDICYLSDMIKAENNNWYTLSPQPLTCYNYRIYTKVMSNNYLKYV